MNEKKQKAKPDGVPYAVFDQPISIASKCVYILLHSRANKEGQAMVSRNEISEKCSIRAYK